MELLRHCPQSELSVFSQKIREIPSAFKLEDGKVDDWLGGASYIAEFLMEKKLAHEIRVLGSHAVYLQVFQLFASRYSAKPSSQQEKLISSFVPSDSNQIIAYLSEAGRITEASRNAVHLMILPGKSWDWNPIGKSMQQRISSTQGMTQEELIGNLVILTYLNKRGWGKANLDFLCDNGWIAHHLAGLQSNVRTAALLMIPLFLHNYQGKSQPYPGQNSVAGFNFYKGILSNPKTYPNYISDFASWLLELDLVEELLIQPIANPITTDFVREALEAIAKIGEAVEIFSPLLPKHYPIIKQHMLQETISTLIRNCVAKKNLSQEAMSNAFSPEFAELYLEIFSNLPPEKRSELSDFLVKAIQKVDKNSWLQTFASQSALPTLLQKLIEDQCLVKLGQSFADALLEFASNVVEGRQVANPSVAWTKFLQCLSSAAKGTFLRNFRDEVLKVPEKPMQSTFTPFYNELITSGVLAEEADKVVRLLFKGILERSNINELRWMSKLLESNHGLLQKCEPESRHNLIERIKDARKASQKTPELRDALKQIAEFLQMPDEEQEVEGDTDTPLRDGDSLK